MIKEERAFIKISITEETLDMRIEWKEITINMIEDRIELNIKIKLNNQDGT